MMTASQRRRIPSSLLWRSRNLAVRECSPALTRKSLKRELGARGRHQCECRGGDPAGWNRHESLGIRFKSMVAGEIEDLLELLLRTPLSYRYLNITYDMTCPGLLGRTTPNRQKHIPTKINLKRHPTTRTQTEYANERVTARKRQLTRLTERFRHPTKYNNERIITKPRPLNANPPDKPVYTLTTIFNLRQL